jgi:hypothetical protein
MKIRKTNYLVETGKWTANMKRILNDPTRKAEMNESTRRIASGTKKRPTVDALTRKTKNDGSVNEN